MLLYFFARPAFGAPADYFQIHIIDQQTGRGVPLVKLTTTNEIVCYTDSNGIVAWDEPGLMNRDVYFSIESPGYVSSGGGTVVHTMRGGHVELAMRRLNIAERLYRVTGQGIYRDSVLTGYPVPVRQPVLNAQVTGQDTVRVTPYHDKLFWLWGDTNKPSGLLGNFATTSATSELPGHGGLDPSEGINLNYITGPDGFVKPMLPLASDGLKWMGGLVTLHDSSGKERLVATYDVIGKGDVPTETGLAVFNDAQREFERLVIFPSPAPKVGPDGGPPPLRVISGGQEYLYYSEPWPVPEKRVRADWNSIRDLSAYEVFDGSGWVKGGATIRPRQEWWLDFDTGATLDADASVTWNPYRKHWIAILQKNVGEVWYAEGDTPTGPWVYTTRIAIHGDYTFYWPVHHPFFDQEGGRVIYFEGTYTATFSGSSLKTPRYDYNQLMYRLSLDDLRLFLPAPLYHLKDGRYLMRDGVEAQHAWDRVLDIPFFVLAPDRKRDGTVLIGGLFYALPVSYVPVPAPASVLGNWDCKNPDISLQLSKNGERLRATVGGFPSAIGTLHNGIGRFMVHDGKDSYDATASLNNGKLLLKWKSAGDGEATCVSSAPNENWPDSKALVPLFFYDGMWTTQARPGSMPVAQVWRNPMDTLPLDRGAEPVLELK